MVYERYIPSRYTKGVASVFFFNFIVLIIIMVYQMEY